MRALVICGLLLLTVVHCTEARKLKGMKGPVLPAAGERILKKGGKKTKRQGPQSRSCQSSAKSDKVEFTCRSRNLDDSAPKGRGESGSKGEHEHEKSEPVEEGSVLRTVQDENQEEEDTDKSRGVSLTYVEGTSAPGHADLTSSEQINDQIKYVVATSEKGIQVSIEYKQEVEGNDLRNRTETEFKLEFDTLIEYVKGEQPEDLGLNTTISTEAYDWNTDKIIQSISLANWNDISAIISDEFGVVSYFTATAELSSLGVAVGPTGVTEFNFTVSEAELGEHMTANTMKIDVRILDFPWKRSDSYIALLSTVDSKKTVQMAYNEDALVQGENAKLTQDVYVAFEEELQVWGVEAFGEYTWESDATVTENLLAASSSELLSRGAFRRALLFEGQDGTFQNGDSPNNKPPKDDIVAAIEEEEQADTSPTGKEPTEESTAAAEETHAAVSTTKIQVVATSPASEATENHQQIAYSFVGDSAHAAKEIYWDPEAGVGYYEPEESIGYEEDGGAPGAEEKSAAWALSRSFSAATTMMGVLLYVAL